MWAILWLLSVIALVVGVVWLVRAFRQRRSKRPGLLALAASPVLFVIAMLSFPTDNAESQVAQVAPPVSAPAPTPEPEPEPEETAAPTCAEIERARRDFEVEVTEADFNNAYGVGEIQNYRVRARVTNNSEMTLPYLTVYWIFERDGERHTSSRAPALDTHSIAPGDTVEVEHYVRGFIPGATTARAEVEDVIQADVREFFEELEGCRS